MDKLIALTILFLFWLLIGLGMVGCSCRNLKQDDCFFDKHSGQYMCVCKGP